MRRAAHPSPGALSKRRSSSPPCGLQRLESRLCLASDVPIPELSAEPVVDGGAADYDFVGIFRRNYLLDHSTLDSHDMLVTGPNGFSQEGSLAEVMPGGFTSWARYRIAAPGGSWDTSDNGIYTISLLPDAVFDVGGIAISPAALGTFVVNIPMGGDANRDNTVDFKDFEILRANFGKTQANWDAGDFNGDGVVSFADFQILEANFGKSQPPVVAGVSTPSGIVPVIQLRPRAPMTKVGRVRW